MMRWLSLWCLMVPVMAAAAGLQPGEYRNYVNAVIGGTPMPIPPRDVDRNVCVTATDVADKSRLFAQMQNNLKRDCELTNAHFTADNATWHTSCRGGTAGDSKAVWNGDHYSVQTHMIQPAGGMQIAIDITVTGKRTGDCSK